MVRCRELLLCRARVCIWVWRVFEGVRFFIDSFCFLRWSFGVFLRILVFVGVVCVGLFVFRLKRGFLSLGLFFNVNILIYNLNFKCF